MGYSVWRRRSDSSPVLRHPDVRGIACYLENDTPLLRLVGHRIWSARVLGHVECGTRPERGSPLLRALHAGHCADGEPLYTSGGSTGANAVASAGSAVLASGFGFDPCPGSGL